MKNKKILISRSPEQNKEFQDELERKGVIVEALPMIQFESIEDLSIIHSYLDRLEEFDWIVFTSAATVDFFFKIAEAKGVKFYFYPKLKIATVGEKTKLKLEQLGYRTNFVPIQYTAEVLAENMDENLEGKNILVPQSNLASQEYLTVFKKRKANPTPVTIYTTKPIQYSKVKLESVLEKKLDYLTFTSGSTFDSFMNNISDHGIRLGKEKIVCIGPSTAKVVEESGHRVSAIAKPHTIDGIIKAIEKLEQHV